MPCLIPRSTACLTVICCLLLPVMVLIIAPPALADHQPLQLEPVTVSSGQLGQSLTPSATDIRDQLFNQPRSTTVLDSDSWEDGMVASQEDTLKRAPGVWVVNQNGGADVFLSIRGSGLSNLAFGRGINSYQDGVPLSRLDNGTTDQLIDPMAYDHVQIYRGASALHLGSTASGGAVNYVSRTGQTFQGWQWRSEAGSFGWRSNRLVWGEQKDKTDAFVVVSQSDLQGYREQSAEFNKRASGNVGYQFDNGVENRVYFAVTAARLELPGNIPLNQLDEDTRRNAAVLNKQYDADRNWRDARFANRTLVPLDSGNQFIASVFVNRSHLDHLPTPFIGIIDNHYEAIGAGLEYHGHIGEQHTIVAGVRHGQGRDTNQRYRSSADGKDKLDIIYDERFRIQQTEFYTEHTQQLTSRWSTSMGAQWTHSYRRSQDRLYDTPDPDPCVAVVPAFPPNPQPSLCDNSWRATLGGFSPKAGLMYQVAETQRVYAQLAKAIGLPTSGEQGTQPVPGTRIDQEESVTMELGYRGVEQYWAWDLVIYRARFQDELLHLTIDGATALFNSPTATRHDGVEAALTLQLPPRWLDADELTLDLVYNWTNYRFDNDPDYGRSRLPKIPEYTLFAALQWRSDKGLLVEPSVRYVSSYPLTYDNAGGRAWTIPAYYVLGLRVSQRFANGLTLFADGRNLTDEVYVGTGETKPSPDQPTLFNPDPSVGVTPGVGRAFYAGFEYRF